MDLENKDSLISKVQLLVVYTQVAQIILSILISLIRFNRINYFKLNNFQEILSTRIYSGKNSRDGT